MSILKIPPFARLSPELSALSYRLIEEEFADDDVCYIQSEQGLAAMLGGYFAKTRCTKKQT